MVSHSCTIFTAKSMDKSRSLDSPIKPPPFLTCEISFGCEILTCGQCEKWKEINPPTPAGISHWEAIFHARRAFHKSPRIYFTEKAPFVRRTKGAFSGGVRGIWTLARLLTAYSLSRGAPSASWVSLRIKSLYFHAWVFYHIPPGLSSIPKTILLPDCKPFSNLWFTIRQIYAILLTEKGKGASLW